MKKLKLKIINGERDGLTAIEKLWESKPGTEEHDALEVLALLVEDYEKRTFPMEEPDPVEAIRFRLEQMDKDRFHARASCGATCANLMRSA